MFSGSIPALITPFTGDQVDEARLAALVERQIAGGSSALVPCGTTGEASTLSMEEHHRVVALTIQAAARRVPVIAGCGSNDTATALHHIEQSAAAGAAAALVVAPYYNRPDADGLVAHYTHLARASALPIVLYNVPSRTITDITPAVVERLAGCEARIVGIKDASGDMAPRGAATGATNGAGYCQLSGNDDSALAHRALGGTGCISVTANVAPRAVRRPAGGGGPRASGSEARAIGDRLAPAPHGALFCGPSACADEIRASPAGGAGGRAHARLPIRPAERGRPWPASTRRWTPSGLAGAAS